MANLTVNTVKTSLPVAQTTSAPVKAAPQQTEAPSRLAADVVEKTSVKKGVVPTLKGAGAGLIGGGLAAALPITLLAVAAKGSSGDGGGALVTIVLGMSAAAVGATSGALSGAVVANSTADKGKGALIGAGVGAVAGAATLGLMSKGNVGTMVLGGVAGALMGAAGGFAGSMVAKH